MSVRLFTIGFAQTSAETFFSLLRASGAKRLIDVRLNNTSQLAGFTKRDDLRFFLREVCAIEYLHLPELAPTQEMLDGLKKQRGSWAAYEEAFNSLITSRCVETFLDPGTADLGCFLCSEKLPDQCHRRLLAEYLQQRWPDVLITHLF